jgi:hypothetical protein
MEKASDEYNGEGEGEVEGEDEPPKKRKMNPMNKGKLNKQMSSICQPKFYDLTEENDQSGQNTISRLRRISQTGSSMNIKLSNGLFNRDGQMSTKDIGPKSRGSCTSLLQSLSVFAHGRAKSGS